MSKESALQSVWIGLAEVRQRPGTGVLLDRNEAIVNVLAMASDEPQFRSVIAAALDHLGFDLVDLEDPEPIEQRLQHYTIAEDLLQLADEVKRTGTPRCGKFHTWISDS